MRYGVATESAGALYRSFYTQYSAVVPSTVQLGTDLKVSDKLGKLPGGQVVYSYRQLSSFHSQMETNQHKEIIRASDIGTYHFCNRAWWLKHAKEEQSTNIVEMSKGTRQHEKHSRTVKGAIALQRVGYGLIGLALVFITLYFLLQLT